MRYLHKSSLLICLFFLPPSVVAAADQKPATPQYTSVRRLAENVTLAFWKTG